MSLCELDIAIKILRQANLLGRKLSKLGLLAVFVKIMRDTTKHEIRVFLGRDYDEILREALERGIISIRGTRVKLTWVGELFLTSLASLLDVLTFLERYYT